MDGWLSVWMERCIFWISDTHTNACIHTQYTHKYTQRYTYKRTHTYIGLHTRLHTQATYLMGSKNQICLPSNPM